MRESKDRKIASGILRTRLVLSGSLHSLDEAAAASFRRLPAFQFLQLFVNTISRFLLVVEEVFGIVSAQRVIHVARTVPCETPVVSYSSTHVDAYVSLVRESGS